MHHRRAARARAGYFQQPMIPADFGYSPLGALAAIALALALATVLYALTVWPLETLGWLGMAVAVRFAGRHPIEALFRR